MRARQEQASPDGACGLPDAGRTHTHGSLRDNARSDPLGRISLVLFSHTNGCTPNVSLDLDSIEGTW